MLSICRPSTPSDNSRDSYALCIDESNTTKDLHYDSTNSDSTCDSNNDSTCDSDNDTPSEKESNENDEAVKDMSDTDSEEQSEKPRAVYEATLPTTEDLVALEVWRDKEDNTVPTQAERIAVKARYSKAVLNSPPNPETHTIEKERIHRTRENEKTYGFYENAGDGET